MLLHTLAHSGACLPGRPLLECPVLHTACLEGCATLHTRMAMSSVNWWWSRQMGTVGDGRVTQLQQQAIHLLVTYGCLRPSHSWSAQLTLQHGGCLVCAPQMFRLAHTPVQKQQPIPSTSKCHSETIATCSAQHTHTHIEGSPSPAEFLPRQGNEHASTPIVSLWCASVISILCRRAVADVCNTTETINRSALWWWRHNGRIDAEALPFRCLWIHAQDFYVPVGELPGRPLLLLSGLGHC
jgi:hypothetical protein